MLLFLFSEARFRPEREFFLFDGPGGAMGIGFWGGRWDLFFARQREKNCGVFWVRVFLVFLLFFWGVCFVLFFVCFLFFARSAKIFFGFFFPR